MSRNSPRIRLGLGNTPIILCAMPALSGRDEVTMGCIGPVPASSDVTTDRQEIAVNQGSINVSDQPAKLPTGTLSDYLALARFDHSTKHIFIVPGIVLVYLLRGAPPHFPIVDVILGLITAICIASANYVINEYLDREFDKHHPTKSARRAVQTVLSGSLVKLEWVLFAVVGLGCALISSKTMFFTAAIFALQGIVYNVPPLRSKNLPYWDVISESINNPLRLTIGWVMIDPTTLPPSSIILAYWFGGAFLMAAKRYSEYREIVGSHGAELLIRYRASFAGYSEVSLNISCFVYGLLSTFFLAIFLIKYRVEYLLLLPVIIALFGYYLALSTRPASSAQAPEKLFRERKLIALVGLLAITFVITSYVDMPALDMFYGQQYITLK
jgi:4-hydroxybenzoate polyprenyltransferase